MTSPTLATIVRRSLEGECSLPRGTTVLAAVSGGPDSMALLSVLATVAPQLDLRVRAHGVDHGLRAEATAELQLAATFADRVGVPWSESRVDVPRGANVQARAREQRWTALVEVARAHGAAIATGHHADDRAETVLMRLLRGSGTRGLGVLPPRATAPSAEDVVVVRPLLRAGRSDVMAHLRRHNVPFATDPSNADPRYLRTRVRREVLPLLAQLDPGIVRHLTALADELVGEERAGETARTASSAGPEAWTLALPRPTQQALRELRATRSPTAKVWLPGGFVASVGDAERRPRPPRRR